MNKILTVSDFNARDQMRVSGAVSLLTVLVDPDELRRPVEACFRISYRASRKPHPPCLTI